MASTWSTSWGTSWGGSWGAVSEVDLTLYERMTIRDVKYEALRLVVTPSDASTMEHAYWLSLFGGRGTTADMLHEGIILGLGYSALKDYYDNITGTTWPDHNISEKAYWLKIISDNL